MTLALIIGLAVILAVSCVIRGVSGSEPEAMSEAEAADRLRPHSGAVEFAPQRPPVE